VEEATDVGPVENELIHSFWGGEGGHRRILASHNVCHYY
jgi:hypothetical protein